MPPRFGLRRRSRRKDREGGQRVRRRHPQLWPLEPGVTNSTPLPPTPAPGPDNLTTPRDAARRPEVVCKPFECDIGVMSHRTRAGRGTVPHVLYACVLGRAARRYLRRACDPPRSRAAGSTTNGFALDMIAVGQRILHGADEKTLAPPNSGRSPLVGDFDALLAPSRRLEAGTMDSCLLRRSASQGDQE